MAKVTRILTAGLVLVMAGWALAAAVEMNPGEWEITTTMKMQGIPGMPGQMPPQVNKQCLTEKELVPSSEQQAEGCKVTEQKTDGNTVTWKLTCDDAKSGMKGSGSGTLTYSGDAMEGAFTMKMLMPGQPEMTMDAKMKGKRLGPCKP